MHPCRRRSCGVGESSVIFTAPQDCKICKKQKVWDIFLRVPYRSQCTVRNVLLWKLKVQLAKIYQAMQISMLNFYFFSRLCPTAKLREAIRPPIAVHTATQSSSALQPLTSPLAVTNINTKKTSVIYAPLRTREHSAVTE